MECTGAKLKFITYDENTQCKKAEIESGRIRDITGLMTFSYGFPDFVHAYWLYGTSGSKERFCPEICCMLNHFYISQILFTTFICQVCCCFLLRLQENARVIKLE